MLSTPVSLNIRLRRSWHSYQCFFTWTIHPNTTPSWHSSLAVGSLQDSTEKKCSRYPPGQIPIHGMFQNLSRGVRPRKLEDSEDQSMEGILGGRDPVSPATLQDWASPDWTLSSTSNSCSIRSGSGGFWGQVNTLSPLSHSWSCTIAVWVVSPGALLG